MKIKVLPKETADKIAAGEVIEQPLSVVKELVENSIDAGASQIVVEIKEGGKSYIRVSDNGCGIEKDDIKTAFLPHATSKINDASDLGSIESLGFRGEALTSIAAVTRLELRTRTEEDEAGTRLKIEASDILSEEDFACETGTTIIVRDLFFNLPARQKFMKSDTREAALITDFISKMSLCYPNIRFRMINNGNILFSTAGKGDVHNAILTVFNAQSGRNLLPVNFISGDMKLSGYVSSPLESKNNKKYQIYFVNGRLVSSRIIDNAISLAYEDKLFEGHFPAVYLFLEINPAKLDVNIHPRKAEVKFSDDEAVRDFTVRGIRSALLNKEALSVDRETVKPVIKTGYDVKTPMIAEDAVEIPKISFSGRDDIFKAARQAEIIEEKNEEQQSFIEFEKKDTLSFSSLNPIGQIFVTYILATDADGFYIIDQHAAHERIMYEKLLNQFNSHEKSSQMLITPLVVDLSPAEMQTAAESLPLLDRLGFAMEEFGENSFVVREIPSYLTLSEAEDFLDSFFQSADEARGLLQIKKDEIISKACKAAVKAHDSLSLAEISALFSELDKCENPFSCPHGRPTFIKMSEYELERLFKRK